MRKAIILAGGRGERLRPLTEDRPKCMVEVLGSPIMAYQLRWLRAHDVRSITVACGYLHEMIEAHFGSGAAFGVDMKYVLEDKPLGRGGSLKQAWLQTMGNEETVLCLNGDNISNLNINELYDYHNKYEPLATVVTTPLRSPYGIVQTDDLQTVTGFAEKPTLPYGVNAGIYVMNREILDHFPDVGDHEETTFPKLAQTGRLKAFRSHCFWRTVDTVKDIGRKQ